MSYPVLFDNIKIILSHLNSTSSESYDELFKIVFPNYDKNSPENIKKQLVIDSPYISDSMKKEYTLRTNASQEIFESTMKHLLKENFITQSSINRFRITQDGLIHLTAVKFL